jgi:hypothetical protein
VLVGALLCTSCFLGPAKVESLVEFANLNLQTAHVPFHDVYVILPKFGTSPLYQTEMLAEIQVQLEIWVKNSFDIND